MVTARSISIPKGASLKLEDAVPATHFAGLDALRAWSAIAVVVLHACMPYCQPAMPGLVWSVTDTPCGWVTMLMWSIELVIMPIFLVVAGFFAANSMNRSGSMPTLKSRVRRWGTTLAIAVAFITPIDLYVWLLGWVAEGHITPRKMQSLKFATGQTDNLWGLSHLWFLQYILTYVVLLAVFWNRIATTSVRSLCRVILPIGVIVMIATLACRPEIVWGFQHSFLPVFSKWLYSGLFFAGGAVAFRCDPTLQWMSRQGDRLLAAGTLFGIAAVTLGMWSLDRESASVIARTALAVVTVLAATILTSALIGSFTRHVQTVGPIVQRIAAASLLIYLLHHPVVGLAHISAKYAVPDLPAILKVAIVSAIGVAAGLAADFVWRSRRDRIARVQVAASVSTGTVATISFGSAVVDSNEESTGKRSATKAA